MGLLKKLFLPSRENEDLTNNTRPVASTATVVPKLSIPAAVRSRVIAEAFESDAAGRFGRSLALLHRALETAPSDPELLFARASTLFAWGRLREAHDATLPVEAMGLRTPALYLKLGWSSFWMGNATEAKTWMQKAVDAGPNAWFTYFGLASVLQARKETMDAISAYEHALALDPGNIHCLINLVACRMDLNDLVAAEAQARRAVAVDTESALVWSNLGVVLARLDRYDEAFESFARAEELDANGDAESFVNFSTCLRDAGRTQAAIDLYDRHLPQRPNVIAHGHHALALLTAGRMKEGWSYFESRWLKEPLLSLRPGFRAPVWSGQDLSGKIILLRDEQGIGDVIQFIRYAPMVKGLGATVLLQLRSGIDKLAESFPGVDRILSPKEPYPEFDFYSSMMSLPRVFGTELDSIPAVVPYLHSDIALVQQWASRLGAGDAPKVGLVWAGDPMHLRDRYRSVTLPTLGPVLSIPGVRFVSMQKGTPLDQLDALPPGVDFVNLGPQLEDFSDTAAVISQLDLVICVDTSVAHLAGAMGRPVWTLIPEPSDFRWLEKREDSPWYPTMRLFRQRQQGDWREVAERVRTALLEWVGQHRAGTLLTTRNPNLEPSNPKRPVVVNMGASPGVRPGFCGAAETRVGLLQYLPHVVPVGQSIDWYGEYLQLQLNLLARMVPPGSTVMEVGAGTGVHSVFLTEHLGTTGHLFVHEADPLLNRIMRQNLAANGTDKAAVTIMRHGLGSGLDAEALAEAEVGAVAESLDDWQLRQLHLLKIGEGVSGMGVLSGAVETVWRLRPLLFVAVANRGEVECIAHRVREFSYRCWRMETPLFNPDNFNRRDSDIFGGRVALALLAIPEEIEVNIELDQCVELP